MDEGRKMKQEAGKKKEETGVSNLASPISLGPVNKIPLGQGFCFVVGSEEIAVFRPRGGGLIAISNRCPHRNAPLCDGVIDQEHVICPYHGHKFHLVTGQGAEKGETVKSFAVCEEKGEIFLKL